MQHGPQEKAGRDEAERRPARRALLGLAVAAALALMLGSAGSARAGTYTIHHCNYPGFAQKPTAGWSVRSFSGWAFAIDTCTDAASGAYRINHGNSSGYMGVQWNVFADITVPASHPGVTIAGSKIVHSIPAVSCWTTCNAYVQGGGGVTNALLENVTGTGRAQATWSWTPPAGTRDLYLGLYCDGPSDCYVEPRHSAVVLHGAELTLHEDVNPSAPTIDGGSLLSSGPRSGSETLDYAATDTDSGVAKVDVKLGPTRIGGDDFSPTPARCPHVSWNACARDTGNQSVPVDTRLVADGIHNLTVTATDAAGNTRSVSGGQVTVKNAAQPAPPPGGSGGGGGSGGSGSGSGGQHGQLNGLNGGPGAKLSASDKRGRRKIRVKADQSARISGRLLSKDDKPVSDARLTIYQQEIGSAQNKELGQVTTGADGRFSYLAVPGRSRKVLVTYRSYPEDTTFTSTSHVHISSIAVVRLRVSSVRTRPGVRLRLGGKVVGRPYPRQGVLVVLQGRARGSRQWRTFATTRTGRRGRFAASYRFRTRGRFELRALAKADSGWHYSPGVSGARRIGVR